MEHSISEQIPPAQNLPDHESLKNRYCKVCWEKKGEYRCLGGMICADCLKKLPYEMRGDLDDVFIYDVIKTAKHFDLQREAGKGKNIMGQNNRKDQAKNDNAGQSENVLPAAKKPSYFYLRNKKTIITTAVIIGVIILAAILTGVILSTLHNGTDSLNAEKIVLQLEDHGFPITETAIFDLKTDSNGITGLDGEYSSKAEFSDERCDNALSCRIEVFNNDKDAEKRREYLTKSNEAQENTDTIFIVDNVITVLDSSLNTSDAEEYQKAITAIVRGEDYSTPAEIEEDGNEKGLQSLPGITP